MTKYKEFIPPILVFFSTWYQSPRAWIEKNFLEYTVEGVRDVFETPSSRVHE